MEKQQQLTASSAGDRSNVKRKLLKPSLGRPTSGSCSSSDQNKPYEVCKVLEQRGCDLITDSMPVSIFSSICCFIFGVLINIYFLTFILKNLVD